MLVPQLYHITSLRESTPSRSILRNGYMMVYQQTVRVYPWPVGLGQTFSIYYFCYFIKKRWIDFSYPLSESCKMLNHSFGHLNLYNTPSILENKFFYVIFYKVFWIWKTEKIKEEIYSLHPRKQVILGFKIYEKKVILPHLESAWACKNQ